MKEILFVLPGHPRKIAGGYKIVFEYANRFAADGYKVDIGYIDKNALNKYKIPEKLKQGLLKAFIRYEPKWFNLNKNIDKYTFREKNALKKVGNPDIVVATAAITADFVKDHFANSKKIYLIQGFETWDLDAQKLYETYNYGFKNIVISKWLEELVDKHSDEKSIYIKNPIDINKYKINTPISKRDPFTVGMLYHSGKHKGTKYAIAALKEVKEVCPALKVIMFGTSNLSEQYPEWMTYYKNASQSQTIKIYNSISVFVCATINEGFGLTGLEAMACGAALASTDYLGVHEYAVDNKNALLSPVKDVDALANNVIKLITNEELRERLEKNAMNYIEGFSWEHAYNKFKQVCNELSSENNS